MLQQSQHPREIHGSTQCEHKVAVLHTLVTVQLFLWGLWLVDFLPAVTRTVNDTSFETATKI
jgi:hypothetical protein